MPKEPSWIEVFKHDGEWKILNGKTGAVLSTESKKSQAVDRARSKLGSSGDYVYLGAQIYNTDGSKAEQIVGSRAVKYYVRIHSARTPDKRT